MTENYVQDIKNKHHQDERLRSEQITAFRVCPHCFFTT